MLSLDNFFGINIYDFANDISSDEAFIMAFLGFFGFILLIALVFSLIQIITHWFIFKKAGEDGWKALVPVYNTYTLCKIVGVTPWWIVISFIGGFIAGMFEDLSFISNVITIYFNVVISLSLAKSFGKSNGFGLGLFFFGPIFYLILAFDKEAYVGPSAIDPIGAMIDNNTTTGTGTNTNAYDVNSPLGQAIGTDHTQTTQTNNFCTNCGNQIVPGDKFCTRCGKQL